MALNEPQLSKSEIEYLFELPKPIENPKWRSDLLANPRVRGANRNSEMSLVDLNFGLVRGNLKLFVRQSLRIPDDFSVGIAYTDLTGKASCRLIRCNGPHPQAHTNSLDPGRLRFFDTPHVHTLTETYLQSPIHEGEHHAEPTDAYEDVQGALEHLAQLANLQPVNRLWL
jgi:hypothetical protein